MKNSARQINSIELSPGRLKNQPAALCFVLWLLPTLWAIPFRSPPRMLSQAYALKMEPFTFTLDGLVSVL